MTPTMKALLVTTLLLLPTLVQAQIFRLQRTNDMGAAVNAVFDAEILKIQNKINQDLPAAEPKRLMEGMANSQAAAGKGSATDYITHFETVAIGAGVGLGADLEKNKEFDSDLSGAGVMGSVQLGLNMAAFADNTFLGMDPKRLTVMANFFKFDLDRDFDDNNVKADLISFGFNGSYKWIDGNGNRLFGWDGVRLHSGYQYSSTKLNFKSSINETIDENLGGTQVESTITANPTATIESTSHSIPLEISSGVNFLWVMSFYGGVGTDINFGQAQGKGDLNSADSPVTCNGAACGGGVSVRSSADINEKGRVNPLFLRGFAGLQLNLPYVRVFAHANKVFGTEVYSFATGLRLAF